MFKHRLLQTLRLLTVTRTLHDFLGLFTSIAKSQAYLSTPSHVGGASGHMRLRLSMNMTR